MTYYKNVNRELLELARRAVDYGKENKNSMDSVIIKFEELVEDEYGSDVIKEDELNAALEQASYILDFKPGYVEDREYPVKQKENND